jgi:hypothetical protein
MVAAQDAIQQKAAAAYQHDEKVDVEEEVDKDSNNATMVHVNQPRILNLKTCIGLFVRCTTCVVIRVWLTKTIILGSCRHIRGLFIILGFACCHPPHHQQRYRSVQ